MRLSIRKTVYRDKPGYSVSGKDDIGRNIRIFFDKESQAREFVRRVKLGEDPGDVSNDIWGIRRGKMNPVQIPEKVLAWRERKKKGSIMKPSTFTKIKRKAASKYRKKRVGKKVAGKAYYITLLRKYLDTHPGDPKATAALNKMLASRGKIRKNPGVIGKWESPRGKHWVELIETQSGFKYTSSDAGGYLSSTDRESAIAELKRKIDSGYFLPDVSKTPMRRVINNPKYKRELSIPEKHQIRIAKSTLQMSDVGARIMGGMTKEEAREVLRRHGVRFKENPKLRRGKMITKRNQGDVRSHRPVKWYIGILPGNKKRVFSSYIVPTKISYPKLISAIGPFSSKERATSYGIGAGYKKDPGVSMVKRGKVLTLTEKGWIDSKGRIVKYKYPKWKKQGSSKSNPPRIGSKVIYDKVISIQAQKGPSSLWPGEHFEHNFQKDKTAAKIVGNPDGSITVRSSKGKKLWKEFSYPDKRK